MENLKNVNKLPLYTQNPAGLGTSTVYADFDFETYSPAGFVWDESLKKWKTLPNAHEKGLGIVGVFSYTTHPEAEVLSLAYNLKDGKGPWLWTPYHNPPENLFQYLAHGGIIEAWNVAFEYWVWSNICVKKYKWPQLNPNQLRCAMAKSRAFSLPGSLDAAGEVLNISTKKDKDGKRLLRKFSIPRDPTKNDNRLRILPEFDDSDYKKLLDYNIRDIEAEAECSFLTPDLSNFELIYWQYDQLINRRGIQIDIEAVQNFIFILEQTTAIYQLEIQKITNGQVTKTSELKKINEWAQNTYNIYFESLTAEAIDIYLKDKNLPTPVRKVLLARKTTNSASVKKLYAMLNSAGYDSRLRDMFIYHAARTGRTAGRGVQPQNLPNAGPDITYCAKCTRFSNLKNTKECPHCNEPFLTKIQWSPDAIEDVIKISIAKNIGAFNKIFDSSGSLNIISACLRGLFIAKEKHHLISSDYSAIEAVVLAALSGEEWRLEVFRTHGKIYEMSASKITGVPFEEFEQYYENNGEHHPLRKKIGKVAELASGYQGWINAWKVFGADEYFKNDDEIKTAILNWRKLSPAIVEFWGGQYRKKNYRYDVEMYGLEGMAINAVLNSGKLFSYRNISYLYKDNILYCFLPSGRQLIYHQPKLEDNIERKGLSLSYMTWNTNPNKGPLGWMRNKTYGGMLTENVVQAIARDILVFAIINLERAGYPVVMHVHDEIVCEIPENFGSIEEFERIMSQMPFWAKCDDGTPWPIKASGGWRNKRYRKGDTGIKII